MRNDQASQAASNPFEEIIDLQAKNGLQHSIGILGMPKKAKLLEIAR